MIARMRNAPFDFEKLSAACALLGGVLSERTAECQPDFVKHDLFPKTGVHFSGSCLTLGGTRDQAIE
jgi:hypothetical protein